MDSITNLNGVVRGRNCIRIISEVGVPFTLIASTLDCGYHRLTESSSEWGLDGITWLMNDGMNGYLFDRRLCQTV